MEINLLQTRLAALGYDLVLDGIYGPATRKAVLAALTNKEANALHRRDIEEAANDLGVATAVVTALVKVESIGHGFNAQGRPVILYEPHVFSRNTDHRFDESHPALSSRSWNRRLYKGTQDGRYGQLTDAIGLDVDAAFMACSWGLGQVLGENYAKCDYPSPWAFAHAAAQSEADQLFQMVQFIRGAGLDVPLRHCTASPDSCRAFVRGYNGPGYEANSYHTRFAREIGRAAA